MLQKGQSVLRTACYYGHTEIVLLLLRYHAAVDPPNDVRHSNTMTLMLVLAIAIASHCSSNRNSMDVWKTVL